MTLLTFYSRQPLGFNTVFTYSQALQYIMIISEDHIIQKELNNLTHILLIWAYPLHLIIKNIKKDFVYIHSRLLSQWTPHTESKILLIVIPFQDISKSFIATIHKN